MLNRDYGELNLGERATLYLRCFLYITRLSNNGDYLIVLLFNIFKINKIIQRIKWDKHVSATVTMVSMSCTRNRYVKKNRLGLERAYSNRVLIRIY